MTTSYRQPDLDALARIVARPEGTPVGRGKVAVPVSYYETAEPANELAADYAWYWPGLLYMAVGLDRSIFAMFQDGFGKSFRVKTHRADEPIVTFAGADKATNPWSGTVQGIPMEYADDFNGFVASYKFVRPGKTWRVAPTPTRLADPLRKQHRIGVWCTLLLPELPDIGRRVSVVKPAGLLLNKPEVGIVHA
jgi:hypothetical protein